MNFINFIALSLEIIVFLSDSPTIRSDFEVSSPSTMKVAPDGSMQIALSNGAYFTFSNQNAFDLDIGAVSVSGTPDGTLKLKADMNIELDAPNIRLKAETIHHEGYTSSKLDQCINKCI